jgi:hypothetical protein
MEIGVFYFCYVIASRRFFSLAATLAPHTSAVSNLLLIKQNYFLGDCFVGESTLLATTFVILRLDI